MESKGRSEGGSRGESGLLSWSWFSGKLMRVSQCGGGVKASRRQPRTANPNED